MWYRFTAPAGGTITVDTFGSSYDTILAAYTGTCGGALTEVACNDDDATEAPQSRIAFGATGGVEYLLEVMAFGAGPGAATWTSRWRSRPVPRRPPR